MLGAYETPVLLVATVIGAVSPGFLLLYLLSYLIPAFPDSFFSLSFLGFCFQLYLVWGFGFFVMFVYGDIAFCSSIRAFRWIFARQAERSVAEFERQQALNQRQEDSEEQNEVVELSRLNKED